MRAGTSQQLDARSELRATLAGMGGETPEPDPLAALRSRFASGCAPEVAVGAGWHNVLVSMDRALGTVAPDSRYEQIKVSWGCLVVGTTHDGEGADVDGIVLGAVAQASRTCETCGVAGVIRSRRTFRLSKCPKSGQAVTEAAAVCTNPPLTVGDIIDRLERDGAPISASLLRY